MANIYEAARVESKLVDDLLKLTSAKQRVGTETDIQKGRVIEEYGEDLRATTKKLEDAMRKAQKKKRKKKWWEKLVPLMAALIPGIGPIAAGTLTGVVSGASLKKDAKFAESTAKNLQKYIKSTPLKSKWGKSFVGQKALDFKQGRLDTAGNLDDVIEEARKAGSGGNVFKTALTAGITSYLGKMAAQGDLGNIGKGAGKGFFGLGPTVGTVGVDPNVMSAISGPGGVAGGLDAMNAADIARYTGGAEGFFGGKSFADMLSGMLTGDQASMAYASNVLGALRNLQD